MPVHLNSVISTQIQTYDPLLYISLTDKENYCYTTANVMIDANNTPLSTYAPQFTLLNTEIVNYLGVVRSLMTDVTMTFFSYDMMHSLYGTVYDETVNLPAPLLFSINGIASVIKNAPISYFADYATLNGLVSSLTNIGLFTNLPAMITDITNADAAEQIALTTIHQNMTDTIKAKTSALLVDDIPQIGSMRPKRDIGNTMFGSAAGQFEYKKYNTILNLGLTIPPYVI